MVVPSVAVASVSSARRPGASMLVGPVPGVASPPSPAAPASEGAEAGDAPARVLVLPALVSGGLPPSTGAEIRTIVSDELAAEES